MLTIVNTQPATINLIISCNNVKRKYYILVFLILIMDTEQNSTKKSNHSSTNNILTAVFFPQFITKQRGLTNEINRS